MKSHARASAGKKAAPKKKLKHMILRHAENGVIAEHHFMEPEQSGMGYTPPPEPETHVINSAEDLHSHMDTHMPMASKGKDTDKDAASEPDADEDDK